MNLARTVRKIAAFFARDFAIARGYRGALVLETLEALFGVATFYYLSRFVSSPELSSALPSEGGYYAWVRCAMGNFWGFQEAWLSLVASIFDMAIYPTLFVAYLTRLVPWFGVDHRGVMVGLGEETSELLDVFRDLAGVHCDILTIGQYLRPSRDHLPMARLYTPREFAELKTEALRMGFGHVESGPLVRSSYHAHEQAKATGLVTIA